MQHADIELHVRHEEELATLQPLAQALEALGESPILTAAAALAAALQLPRGPLTARVLVLVEGEPSTVEAAAEVRVVIETRLRPAPGPDAPSDALARADLILVPGPAHVQPLQRRYSGEVVAAGLARLDPLCRDADAERIRARREFRAPDRSKLVLAVPDRQGLIEAGIGAVASSGWTVLLLAEDCTSPERLSAWVAREPGLALVDRVKLPRALAAADVVVAEGGSVLFEAFALGKGAVSIETPDAMLEADGMEIGPHVCSAEELLPALDSVFPGTPAAQRFEPARARCRAELLACEGEAAPRMACEIQARSGSGARPGARAASVPPRSRPRVRRPSGGCARRWTRMPATLISSSPSPACAVSWPTVRERWR